MLGLKLQSFCSIFSLNGLALRTRVAPRTLQSGVAAIIDFVLALFLRHAEEFGLEYVEIQNLTEFYEDYRYVLALGE